MISWKVIIIIFLILTFLDKFLTYGSILASQKNFPDALKDDKFKVEKNPISKFFFNNFGLTFGTIILIPLGVITLLVSFLFLKSFIHESVALYSIFIIYGFIVANNSYFLIKHMGLIP